MKTHITLASTILPVLLLATFTGARAQQQEISQLWVGEQLWAFGGSEYRGDADYRNNGNWRSMPGAYVGFRYSGNGPLPEPLEFTIPLDKQLPLGTYRLFVKNFYRGRMEATLGDITRPITIRRFDWSPGVTFETNAPVDKIVLRYYPDGERGIVADTGASQTRNYILQGVFLTTANDQVPVRAGEIIRMLPQKLPDPIEGNALANASFETGVHPWGKRFGTPKLVLPHQLDTSTAAHGCTSLRFRQRLQIDLESPLVRLRPGVYTLSFYAKSATPIEIDAFLFGLSEDLKNYAQSGIAGSFQVDKEWKRYHVTANVTPRTGLLYTTIFRGESDEPSNVWLDAVQFEPGELTEFRPRCAEVGFVCQTPGHIFYEGEPGEVEVRVWAADASGSPKPGVAANVNWEVTDYWGQSVANGELFVPTGDGHGRKVFRPFQSRRGVYRLTFRLGESASEMVYSVMPPNRHLDRPYPDGTLGTDTHFDPTNLAILKRANFNWILSKKIGRWYVVEPERGEYHFEDKAMAAVRENHLSLVIQFLNPSWGAQDWLKPFLKPSGGAEWKDERKKTYLDVWEKYIHQTVEHYKSTVKHWEIENEPNSPYTSAEYAEILRRASRAVRGADPAANVVAFSGGGFNADFYTDVVARVGRDSFDVASVHLYGNVAETHRAYASFLDKIDKPGWNTETGATCPTFFTRLPHFEEFRQDRYWENHHEELRRTAMVSVRNYLTTLSVGGMQRYFHYFARFSNCSPSQPTRWFGGGKEINEFDGSLRANGVGLSIASHFLDGAQYVGPLKFSPEIEAHLFASGDEGIGFLWTTGTTNVEIPFRGNSEFTFYDIMGNSIPRDKVQPTASPIYFRGPLEGASTR